MIKLFKKNKKQSFESILDDPLQIEAIAKLAKDCGRFFEVIRPSDGTIFRFYKHGEGPEQSEKSVSW